MSRPDAWEDTERLVGLAQNSDITRILHEELKRLQENEKRLFEENLTLQNIIKEIRNNVCKDCRTAMDRRIEDRGN